MILHKIKSADEKIIFLKKAPKKYFLSLNFCVGLEKIAKFYFPGCFRLKVLILVFNFSKFSEFFKMFSEKYLKNK